MNLIIKRDYKRKEKDDFTLNVSRMIIKDHGATEIYNEDGEIIAWQIKPLYE